MLGASVCLSVAERHLALTTFPDLTALYRRMGLVADGHTIRYTKSAPQLHARTRIMRPGGR